MLEIAYTKRIPYPFAVTLSQYFDYEHIAHVHPTTVGEYRLVEKRENFLVYDQIWPPGLFGRRAVSRVQHRFQPPDEMWFTFVSGRYRGIIVHTRLEDRQSETLVHETYRLPLPNWAWLKPLVRPGMMRAIERIWDEDLRVEICYGGWPGIPGYQQQPKHTAGKGVLTEVSYVLGRAQDFPPCSVRCVMFEGQEIAVFAFADHYRAVSNRCPHTGGPLVLGTLQGETIVCPWHGATFDLCTGHPLNDTTPHSIQTYTVRRDGERLRLYM